MSVKKTSAKQSRVEAEISKVREYLEGIHGKDNVPPSGSHDRIAVFGNARLMTARQMNAAQR